MNKLKSFGVIIIFLIITGNQLLGQISESATFLAKFITAKKYLRGDGVPRNIEKAIELYNDCAQNGKLSFAMNELGSLYKKGREVPKDLNKAFYWYSKSVEQGDPIGMFYLGTMYKAGEGVIQDFSKAFEYFMMSAEKGFYGGLYAAGYCKYKGLGTPQSYSEAVLLFQKGVDMGDPPSKLMLGICLRNGYGVERNEIEALRLLQEASTQNLTTADNELKNNLPENSEIKMDQSQLSTNKHLVFKKINKNQNDISLTGEWKGTRYFFDWSGIYLIGRDSLRIIIKQNEKKIKGQWFEGGKLLTEFCGIIGEDQIVFDSTQILGKNRYSAFDPIQIIKGQFQSINLDKNYLEGNIESWSPKLKEPGYPCYIVISRAIEKPAKIDTTVTIQNQSNAIEMVSNDIIPNNTIIADNIKSKNEDIPEIEDRSAVIAMYPNPFTDEVNVLYKTIVSNEVQISVYSLNGTLICDKKRGTIRAGNYSDKIRIPGNDGAYIIKVKIGPDIFSKTIIKCTE